MDNQLFQEFLQKKGFKLVKNETGGPFGNYYYDYENTNLFIRVTRDRNFLSLDVSPYCDKKEFYDMTIICMFMTKEENLLITYEFNDLISYFISNYDAIVNLLSVKQYQETKVLLKKLKHARAMKMFPGMFPDNMS